MYMYIRLYSMGAGDTMYVHTCYRLRKEYEIIADRALTTPTNTEHLMTLKEEIATVMEKTLPELETKIIEARHRWVDVSN